MLPRLFTPLSRRQIGEKLIEFVRAQRSLEDPMDIADSQLHQIMPNLPADKRAAYLPPLVAGMTEFDISTPARAAAYLAQLAHESAELKTWSENLNYRAEALVRLWPKRFTAATAAAYAHNPEKIANLVYANRMGNGDEASGDGWHYRGRGPIQQTGRDLYLKCGGALGVDLVANPDLMVEPSIGFRASAWLWAAEKVLNPLADAGDFKTITKRINGGLNGYTERVIYWTRAKAALAA